MNAYVFHPGDEIQDVAAMFAFAETVPDILADAHPELRRVLAFVDGTRPAQAISASFEPVKQAVMLEHLLHGDGRFDGLEVNKRCFGHGYSYIGVFNCEERTAAQEIEPPPRHLTK